MNSDLKEIENLREQDIHYSIGRNTEGLLSLWTEDGVLLLHDQEPIIGIRKIKEYLNAAKRDDIEITRYKFDFKETRIMADFAYEWGYYDHQYRDAKSQKLIDVKGNIMRILRKDHGTWKVARVMGT
ncbi:YybH family protein [Bacteroidota bacterium]